jgi:hypothetical protein
MPCGAVAGCFAFLFGKLLVLEQIIKNIQQITQISCRPRAPSPLNLDVILVHVTDLL